MRILVICTGNICRSPMAAGFLRTGAHVVGLDAEVASAGFVTHNRPADADAVAVMREWGIDIGSHRSHRLGPSDIAQADLVLAMAREHVVQVVGMDATTLNKTLTLKELVRRACLVGARKQGEEIADWLDRVSVGRNHAVLVTDDTVDDVADPIGMGRRTFRRTAEELDILVWALIDLLTGYLPKLTE